MSDNSLAVRPENEGASEIEGISVYADKQLSPEWVSAYTSLTTGKIPKTAIQVHKGKGGKPFRYVSHIWIQKQIRRFFQHAWSWDVLETIIDDDNSATALGRLTLYIPLNNGQFFTRTITEVGAFDGGGGKMSKSNMRASAASRALYRCALRAFGIGEELYEDDMALTPELAWDIIKTFLARANNAALEVQFLTLMSEMGIKSADLVDLDIFEKAMQVAQELYREEMRKRTIIPTSFQNGTPPEEPTEAEPDPAPEKPSQPPVQLDPVPAPAPKEQGTATPKFDSLKRYILKNGGSDQVKQFVDEYMSTEIPIADLEKDDTIYEMALGLAQAICDIEVPSKAVAIVPPPDDEPAAEVEPVKQILDPYWEPKSWPDVVTRLAKPDIGITNGTLITIMRTGYPPNTFDGERLQEYWAYIADYINSGKIEVPVS